MASPETLTLYTALELAHSYPTDGQRGVCLEDLVHKTCDNDGILVIVKLKVCKSYFYHKVDLESRLKSATPNLNICPLDCSVIYGSERVPQEPVNLPTFTEFPGHEVEGHEVFYSNRGLENDMLYFDHVENQGTSVSNSIPAQREDFNSELVDFFNTINEECNASPNSQDEPTERPQAETVFLASLQTLPDDDELDPVDTH